MNEVYISEKEKILLHPSSIQYVLRAVNFERFIITFVPNMFSFVHVRFQKHVGIEVRYIFCMETKL